MEKKTQSIFPWFLRTLAFRPDSGWTATQWEKICIRHEKRDVGKMSWSKKRIA